MKAKGEIVERHLWSKSGSEGPRHDPYAYTEYCLDEKYLFTHGSEHRLGHTLHMGLAVWYETWLNGEKVFHTDNEAEAVETWERFSRLNVNQLDKLIHEKKFKRCPHCGSKKGYFCADGFPGETLTICLSCESIVDSELNLSAIE